MEYIEYIDKELESYRLSPKWNSKIIDTEHDTIIMDFSLNLFKIESLSLFKNLLDRSRCKCGNKATTICYGPFETQESIIKLILNQVYPDTRIQITLKEILIAYIEYHKSCHISFVCKKCNKHKDITTYDLNSQQFNVYPVEPDGHCFFRCISIYLKKTVEEIRYIVADYMISYKSDFIDSYEPDENNNDSYEEFVEKIRTTNEWADNLVIIAIQLSLRESIEIYYEQGEELILTRDVTIQSDKKPIKILFNGTNHYDLLYESIPPKTKTKIYTEDELNELTVTKIKKILSKKHIDFNKKSKKANLIQLYLESI